MIAFLHPAFWVVSGLIIALMAVGFGFEWIGVKLVPLQKLLTKKIEEKS